MINSLSLLVGLTVLAAADPSVVHVKNGDIQGTVTGLARVFRGIPYASPPIEANRWKSPLPAAPWAPKVLSALEDGAACPQACALPPHACPTKISEDCLFLNVFTPTDAEAGKTKYPVMMFIHGGNFKQGYGGGPLYDASNMVNRTGVIVVAINYRLGALGWAYTSNADGGIRGSYGLEDQRLAMAWIKDNIAAFGGNPEGLTLFGQSAGASSIAAHMIAPASEPLFAKAIMESDPTSNPFRSAAEQVDLSSAMATFANCTDTKAPGVDECLRALTADQIVDAQAQAETDILASVEHLLEIFLPWTPTFDPTGATPASVPAQPVNAFAAGKAYNKPLIIGNVQNEALVFIFEAFTKPADSLEYYALLAAIYGLDDALKVAEKYPLPDSEKNDVRHHLSNIGTYSIFVCPSRYAIAHSQAAGTRTAPSFLYRFDHKMSFSKQGWGPNFSACYDYVCHGGELPFVFNSPEIPKFNITFTPGEVTMSNSIQDYWSSFAKYSDPSGAAVRPDLPQWSAYNSTTKASLRFLTPTDVPQMQNLTSECDWWDTEVGYNFA